jgi:hypothetical protein
MYFLCDLLVFRRQLEVHGAAERPRRPRRHRDGGRRVRRGGGRGRPRRRARRPRGEEAEAGGGPGARAGAVLRGRQQAGPGAKGPDRVRPPPPPAPGRRLVPEPPRALEDQADGARLQRSPLPPRRAPPRVRRATP